MMERIKYLQTESDNWEDIDIPTTLSTPVTTSEAAAAIAALRPALPDVPSDAAMQRACVALVARLLGVAP
jgi:hypothetical protein